jgi:hypothetical protein
LASVLYERLIQVSHGTATGLNGALQQQTNRQVGYGGPDDVTRPIWIFLEAGWLR